MRIKEHAFPHESSHYRPFITSNALEQKSLWILFDLNVKHEKKKIVASLG